MRYLTFCLFFLGLQIISWPYLFAQVTSDSTYLWLVKTNDGNEYVGELLSQDNQELQLRTRNLGEITIQQEDIVSMEQLGPERMQQQTRRLRERQPHTTRYFFAPNGYNLAQGEGYYQNTWVLFNQANVGITDHFSLGVGTIPLFLFAGSNTPFWITPKVSIPVSPEQVNIGIGGLIGTTVGYYSSSFGVAYGVSTFGSRDRNVTIGLGYGFADGEWADVPLITLGGISRVGERTFLLTENYFLDAGDEIVLLVSLGGRSIIGRAASLDYGLFIPVGNIDAFVAVPWLSVTIPFGKSSSR